MPYRKTSARRRRRIEGDDLTSDRIEHLFSSYVLLPVDWKACFGMSAAFASKADAKVAWEANRNVLLRWFADGVPADPENVTGRISERLQVGAGLFCRPWAWWQFDAPEHRRIIAVTDLIRDNPTERWLSRCVDRSPTEAEVAAVWKHSGGESYFGKPRYGGLFTCEDDEAYLRRLDLLTKAERAA